MSCELLKVDDPESPFGWSWLFPYAYGASAAMRFRGIKYLNKTPTNDDGMFFQLLIKANRSDPDSEAVVNVGGPLLSISSDPLMVGYVVDTTTEGFTRSTRFPGELWVIDSSLAAPRQLVNTFFLELSNSVKQTFV